jgi:phage regulator Rha-like protein
MDKLVFINSNNLSEEPFTTSKIIAKYGGQTHHSIQVLISTYEKDLKEFGVFSFEMSKPKSSKGGRPEKIYKLSESQASFLITLMKNTRQVVNFKKALVKQFYAMREELLKRRIERSDGKKERTTLTDAISRLPDGKYKEHLYSNITRLIYKILFNKTILQLKEQFNVPKKGNLRDYLPQVQLAKVKVLEERTSVLIDMGLPYEEIKLILNKYAKS